MQPQFCNYTYEDDKLERGERAIGDQREKVERHSVPELRVLEALADLLPAPGVVLASAGGIGHDACVRHELFALGEPPHLGGVADKDEHERAEEDGRGAQEQVDDAPAADTACFLGAQRNVVDAD